MALNLEIGTWCQHQWWIPYNITSFDFWPKVLTPDDIPLTTRTSCLITLTFYWQYNAFNIVSNFIINESTQTVPYSCLFQNNSGEYKC